MHVYYFINEICPAEASPMNRMTTAELLPDQHRHNSALNNVFGLANAASHGTNAAPDVLSDLCVRERHKARETQTDIEG